jgi:hypothetical protein
MFQKLVLFLSSGEQRERKLLCWVWCGELFSISGQLILVFKYRHISSLQIWDGQLLRGKCYHHLGESTFSIVNVYFLCLQWLVNIQCLCVCMCSSFKTFPEFTDIIYMNPLLQFTGFPTVNKEMNINILCHPRDAVRRKCPKKWRTNSWFLLPNNAPEHRSVLVKDFSSTNNVTTVQHLPYSLDLIQLIFTCSLDWYQH